MIINKPHLCTVTEVWQPKYNSQSLTQEYDEPVALLHKRKVDFGSPILIIKFTKAKHLIGQRFAIRKQDAQRHAVGSNGRAPMYEVPLSSFEAWESGSEVANKAKEMFA